VKKRADLLDLVKRPIPRVDYTTEQFGTAYTYDTGVNGLFFTCSRSIRGMKAIMTVNLAWTTLETNIDSGSISHVAESIGDSLILEDFTKYSADDLWMADLMHFNETFVDSFKRRHKATFVMWRFGGLFVLTQIFWTLPHAQQTLHPSRAVLFDGRNVDDVSEPYDEHSSKLTT
jgi:hypothetical protein